jgi:hypothetical protein
MGSPVDISARDAFHSLVDELLKRQATGRGLATLQLDQELVSALLESGARLQQQGEVSDVHIEFFDSAAHITCRVRVSGRAFPPRPPVDTRVTLGIRDITWSDAGHAGSVMFRVEQPLVFSSRMVDLILPRILKAVSKFPVSVDALRHKDSLVTIDFAELVAAVRPDLAAVSRQIRLYGLAVEPGLARVQLGFVRPVG